MVMTGYDTFYTTKSNNYRTEFKSFMEMFLVIASGGVIYYDGKSYKEVVSGLLFANGINISRDKK